MEVDEVGTYAITGAALPAGGKVGIGGALRRLLVDHGQLERTRDGGAYRVGFPPGSVAFDLEIFDLDLPATVAAFRMEQERQRRERRARSAEPGGGG